MPVVSVWGWGYLFVFYVQYVLYSMNVYTINATQYTLSVMLLLTCDLQRQLRHFISSGMVKCPLLVLCMYCFMNCVNSDLFYVFVFRYEISNIAEVYVSLVCIM